MGLGQIFSARYGALFVSLKGKTCEPLGQFQNAPSQCFLENAEEEFRENSIDVVEFSNMLISETSVDIVGCLRNGNLRGDSGILEKDLNRKICGDIGILGKDLPMERRCR